MYLSFNRKCHIGIINGTIHSKCNPGEGVLNNSKMEVWPKQSPWDCVLSQSIGGATHAVQRMIYHRRQIALVIMECMVQPLQMNVFSSIIGGVQILIQQKHALRHFIHWHLHAAKDEWVVVSILHTWKRCKMNCTDVDTDSILTGQEGTMYMRMIFSLHCLWIPCIGLQLPSGQACYSAAALKLDGNQCLYLGKIGHFCVIGYIFFSVH